MGRSLVKSALSHGDLVTTVGRNIETSPEAIATLNSDTCLGQLCDVRDGASVARVIQRTLTRFGRIDCIANCSGYGVIGACEDQDEHEIRNQFETSVRRAVGALEGFPIHDELLNDRGRGLITGRVDAMTGTRVVDLRGGAVHEF